MTRFDAIQLLNRVWGSEGVIGSHDAETLRVNELEGETYLDTACRLAGVSAAYRATFMAFNHSAVRDWCARAELEPDVLREQEARRYKR